MICTIIAFMLSSGSCASFVCVTMSMHDQFKLSAYYPYAGAHVGSFVCGFGAAIQWLVMMVAINRVTPFCGKKQREEDDDDGPAMYQAYAGAPPPGYPYGAPPPGAFG